LKSITQKLDLDGYIARFKSFLARDKDIFMHGDINQHFRYISALATLNFTPPPLVINLDYQLNKLSKQGILSLDEIYAFVSIISYFNRLKAMELPDILAKWISKIDIPKEMSDIVGYFNDEGNINPQIEPKLLEIDRAIKQNKAEIKERLYKTAHSSSLRDYMVDSQIHFINSEETLLVRGGFNSVVKASIVARSSGGFFYILPHSISSLKDKNDELSTLREEIVYQYCQKFSLSMFLWHKFLVFLNKEYDKFDHYQARVHFAKANDFEFMLPSKHRTIKLVDFAHPALLNPKPISITIDKPISIVTGVNAGGKTMLLKSILSSVFLSKNLLPFRINASASSIGTHSKIEAIIDDPQSVKNDISTFAGRMVEFSKLFDKEGAIVGVDEIELGTDSDEASALFRVLLETLKTKGSWFVVTTHHKRLASLMGASDEVNLIAALYDELNQTPTYTFLQGIIGKSYAFETAFRYGIPNDIIQEARLIYGEDKENLNELIEKSTSLELQMRQKIVLLDEKAKEIEAQKAEIESFKDDLKQKYRKAEATLENRYNLATKKAREALKSKDLSEGHKLLNEAHKHTPKNHKVPKIEEKKIESFKMGEIAKYRSMQGEIVALNETQASIQIDGLKMKVLVSELKKIEQPKPKPKQKSHKVELQDKEGSRISLKLIGCYGDEAIEKLDIFLSDALVHGFSEIEVIHGSGGGILKRLVREHLSNYPKIKSFHTQDGNLGITIVKL